MGLQDSTASRQSQIGAVSGEPNCAESSGDGSAFNSGATDGSWGGGSDGSAGESAGLDSDPWTDDGSLTNDGSAFEPVESMPSDIGSVMRDGSAQSANAFSGLSSELPSGTKPAAAEERSWGGVAVLGCSGVLLVALVSLAS